MKKGKLKNKKVGGYAAEEKIKSQISPHEVLQSWLIIQSLIFLVKNN